MHQDHILIEIRKLEDQISKLPRGSIGTKKVNGKNYYYHRYNVNGKRIEKYIDNGVLSDLLKQINLRKELETKLKELKKLLNNKPIKKTEFHSSIRIGKELKKFVDVVRKYKKREFFNTLNDYIYNDLYDKVLILYGLRRTGKTTLIRQCILEMDDEMFSRAVYIKIGLKDTLSSLNKDIKKLESMGFKYIFIDEVSLLEEFIEGASLFFDIYASSGMKIVLSGTDSLGFMITNSEQLYNRCILIHTTFIPYREFENVLGIKGIDEYINYGGTMVQGGINYNEVSTFFDDSSTNEYIDTAIAKNIQHSLKYYDYGNHFRNLQELYEKNELTNVINRVVEDINHRFTKEVLTRKFKSYDLAISEKNLRKDKNNPTTILDDIDIIGFTTRLKDLLDILDKNEQTSTLDEICSFEIKEYLKLLDLIYDIDERSFPNINNIKKNIIVTQPGLRYAQAKALVSSLLKDDKFINLTLIERNSIVKRILNEIKGRMMEDIVLLETKIANPKKEVFKLKFAVGEFDMVVFDPNKLFCEIYEIKYSKEVLSNHYTHLNDLNKIQQAQMQFGEVVNRNVIYRGESTMIDCIKYVNVEEYLNKLSN